MGSYWTTHAAFMVSTLKGDIARNVKIILGVSSMTNSISSSVLYRERENRIEPWTAVNGTPIALKTWDGSRDPDVQADPDDAQMPFSSIFMRIASPSTNSKPMFNVRKTIFNVPVYPGLRHPFEQPLL